MQIFIYKYKSDIEDEDTFYTEMEQGGELARVVHEQRAAAREVKMDVQAVLWSSDQCRAGARGGHRLEILELTREATGLFREIKGDFLDFGWF